MAKPKTPAITVEEAAEILEGRVGDLMVIYRRHLVSLRDNRIAATTMLAREIQSQMGCPEAAAFDFATAIRMLVEATNAY